MTDYLLKLYKNYLHRTITKSDFLLFKKEIGKMSDSTLCNLMIDAVASENTETNTMPAYMKEKLFRQIEHKIMWLRIRPILQYAAVLIIGGLFIGLLSKQYYAVPDQEVKFSMATGNKGDVNLPDGTHVKLNSATNIIYHTNTKKQRHVELSGEAYFEVAHDSEKPFKVTVNELQIEVLGTAFNINTHKDGYIETYLSKGKIKLTGDKLKEAYYLSPGQKAIYNKNNHHLKIVRSDDHTTIGWQENYLIFEKEPLCDVIVQIERWYGVHIQLSNNAIASDLLSGSFRNETLENVIESISKQYNFKYRIEKENIIIL